jgi:hypothetical protein
MKYFSTRTFQYLYRVIQKSVCDTHTSDAPPRACVCAQRLLNHHVLRFNIQYLQEVKHKHNKILHSLIPSIIITIIIITTIYSLQYQHHRLILSELLLVSQNSIKFCKQRRKFHYIKHPQYTIPKRYVAFTRGLSKIRLFSCNILTDILLFK